MLTNKLAVRSVLVAFAFGVVGYPLVTWYGQAIFKPDTTLLRTLFPAFGLVAFTVMYLHIIGRPFAEWLETYVPFKTFTRISSFVVLLSIILHPLLRLAYLGSLGISPMATLDFSWPYLLGYIGLLTLLSYDVGRMMKNSAWVTAHWGAIDTISTIGFYVIWVHSLALGSSLYAGPLRTVWILYGCTALVATIYTFFFSNRRRDEIF